MVTMLKKKMKHGNTKIEIQLSEANQLSVWIYDYPLKRVYEFENMNNIGESPLSKRWDVNDKFHNEVGQLANIHLCEYRLGAGGEITIGRWRCGIDGPEVEAMLAFYRETIKKISA